MPATTYIATITRDGESVAEATASTAVHPDVDQDSTRGAAYAQWVAEHAARYRRSVQDVLDEHQDGDVKEPLDEAVVDAATDCDPEAGRAVVEWVEACGFADYYCLDAYVASHAAEPMTREGLVEALAEYLAACPGGGAEEARAIVEQAVAGAAAR